MTNSRDKTFIKVGTKPPNKNQPNISSSNSTLDIPKNDDVSSVSAHNVLPHKLKKNRPNTFYLNEDHKRILSEKIEPVLQKIKKMATPELAQYCYKLILSYQDKTYSLVKINPQIKLIENENIEVYRLVENLFRNVYSDPNEIKESLDPIIEKPKALVQKKSLVNIFNNQYGDYDHYKNEKMKELSHKRKIQYMMNEVDTEARRLQSKLDQDLTELSFSDTFNIKKYDKGDFERATASNVRKYVSELVQNFQLEASIEDSKNELKTLIETKKSNQINKTKATIKTSNNLYRLNKQFGKEKTKVDDTKETENKDGKSETNIILATNPTTRRRRQ